jgi:uncharacterized repeat protein (TIGR02543 family)
MFQNCEELKTLDLSNFDTYNVTNMSYMFYKCYKLTTIYVYPFHSSGNLGWTIQNCSSDTNMFGDCTSLVGEKGTSYDSYCTDKYYAYIDFYISDGDSSVGDAIAQAGYLSEGSRNYTINFDSNGGASVSPVSYVLNTTIQLPTTTKAGYYFSGWSYNGTTYSATNFCVSSLDSSLVTFTAVWNKEKYKLAFTDSTTIEMDYGDSSVAPSKPNTVKTGQYFSKWKDASGNFEFGVGASLQNIDFTPGSENKTQSTITFDGVYENEKYSLTFKNGDTTVSTGTYTYGTKYTLPSVTKTGYIFSGWLYNGTTYTGSLQNEDFSPNEENSTAKSVTLTAQWTPITYTIRFNSNGGSGSMNDMTCTYDTSYNLTKNAFSKSCYIFYGWSTTSGSSTLKYTNCESIKNLASTSTTINLYAIWKDTWANHITSPSGSGTSSNPYKIATANNLAWLSNYCETTGSLSGYFIQTANINLSSYWWLPIGNYTNVFSGSYDGKGYAITNINCYNSDGKSYYGLFGAVRGSTTENAKLSNIVIVSGTVGDQTSGYKSTYGYCGSIVGRGYYIDIIDCINKANVTQSKAQYIGGIAGYLATATVSGCYNYGSVTGTNYVGGIVGYANGVTIENSYANVSINANAYSGGIVGACRSTVTITSCAYEGSVTITGLISGVGTVNITNCYANGYASAMYGGTTATMTNCIFILKGTKHYSGSDFSAWSLSSNNTPLPSGLTWLGLSGNIITTSKLISLGYTSI